MIFKKILRPFNKKEPSPENPSAALEKIPWSEVVKECYDKSLNYNYPIIRVIYSDDKAERAVILQKLDKIFTISFEKLYPFDGDELKYCSSGCLHGYWCPIYQRNSFFDTEESALTEIFSSHPFKYNKSVIWKGISFRIDAENLSWISKDELDDPDDFCLHGNAFAKIGEEIFEYDATVSVTGLYLLRTLTKNHILHEDQPMLPCCGHWMMAKDNLCSVDIGGCPNGIDWAVFHEDGRIKLVTETGNETLVDFDYYREEVFAFAGKIEAFNAKSSPKNLLQIEAMERNGYTAFWNEWRRRRI